MVDTNDEWITARTGIKERRILDKDKGTSYMAAKAAEMVLRETEISASGAGFTWGSLLLKWAI